MHNNSLYFVQWLNKCSYLPGMEAVIEEDQEGSSDATDTNEQGGDGLYPLK